MLSFLLQGQSTSVPSIAPPTPDTLTATHAIQPIIYYNIAINSSYLNPFSIVPSPVRKTL
jgi:hypothetical protein